MQIPSGKTTPQACKEFGITTQQRDECLNGEIFYSLKEAQIVIEQSRRQYNTVRLHAALGDRPPVPGADRPVGSQASQPPVVLYYVSHRLTQYFSLITFTSGSGRAGSGFVDVPLSTPPRPGVGPVKQFSALKGRSLKKPPMIGHRGGGTREIMDA